MTPHFLPDATLTLTGAGGWFGLAMLERVAASRAAGEPSPAVVRCLAGRAAEVPAILALVPDAEVHVGDVASDATDRLLADSTGGLVVHAAGVIHPARMDDFTHTNVEGTRRVLDAATRSGARRVVHVSSNSPFGVNPRPDDVFRHDEPFSPWMGYGRSKMLAELAVGEAVEQGLDAVVVRPPWFYGPWQPERQTRFFTMVRTGRFPVLGDGRQRRSMAYVGNIVDGVLLAGAVPAARGGAFWIADDRPYAMAEVVATVRSVLEDEGYPVGGRTLRLPAAVGRVAERADRMLQGRGRYVQEVHVLGEMDKTIACSIEHSTSVLGYRPRVALAEGMREAIRWCRARGIEL